MKPPDHWLRILSTRRDLPARLRAWEQIEPLAATKRLTPALAERFERATFALAAELIGRAVEVDGRIYTGVDGKIRVWSQPSLLPMEVST